MFLLRTENKRIVGFEALLAQAMSVAVAAPAETISAALTAHQAIYSPPIFEETGDDDIFPGIES